VEDFALVVADNFVDVVHDDLLEGCSVADGGDPGWELRVPDYLGQILSSGGDRRHTQRVATDKLAIRLGIVDLRV
jgi:hypothetical protein